MTHLSWLSGNENPKKAYSGIATEAANMPPTAIENCWDNAVSERFFHSLKTECVNHEKYASRNEATKSIFNYIEIFYNRQRLHSSNGYLSSVAFEKQFKAA